MNSDVLIVIPSRYGSTRFPGKVLARLDGRPMVEWCYRAGEAAKIGRVVVATEDEKVAAAVRGFGGEAVMTPASCASGSDRVFAAAKGGKESLIINVQGDQPLIRPETIRAVADLLRKDASTQIATAVFPLDDESRAEDPNVVKAVLAKDGRALYFSRSKIPYARNGRAKLYEHIGIYGFRREALERFVSLPPSPLELCESLEQLRALEAGMKMSAAVVSETPASIDTPEDLARVELLLKERKVAK